MILIRILIRLFYPRKVGHFGQKLVPLTIGTSIIIRLEYLHEILDP